MAVSGNIGCLYTVGVRTHSARDKEPLPLPSRNAVRDLGDYRLIHPPSCQYTQSIWPLLPIECADIHESLDRLVGSLSNSLVCLGAVNSIAVGVPGFMPIEVGVNHA